MLKSPVQSYTSQSGFSISSRLNRTLDWETDGTSSTRNSAGATDDLRCALLFLSHLVSPKTPLHGLGFSLGGNILSKYLGEEGDQSLLRTAVAVSNPWDLYKGHLFLESSFVQRTYSRVLAFSLRLVNSLQSLPIIVIDGEFAYFFLTFFVSQ